MVSAVTSPRRPWQTCLAALLILAAAAVTSFAHAQNSAAGSIRIEQPWARATPGGARVGSGYLRITNTGKAPDRLIGGSMVAAGRFEVHETRLEGDVMRMRHLDNGLEIKPGETVELKPGSLHVMFMDLKSGLKQGERLKGTLVFEKAGTIEIEYKVEAIGSQGITGESGGGSHKHH